MIEIGDDEAEMITIRVLRRTIGYQNDPLCLPDDDKDEVIAACNKMIQYYGGEP